MKKHSLFIIFPIISFILILTVTQNYELGVTPDSTAYLEISNSIQNGKGIVNSEGNLVSHWPPLYPITLVYFSDLIAQNPLVSAKYLSALLIFLLFVLFNLILKQLNVRFYTCILLNISLLLSVPLTVFLMLWSEGLFLVLLSGSVYFLLNWLNKGNRIYLILSALIAGLMVLTRYAGFGIIGGIIAFFVFFQHKKIKEIIYESLIFISIVLILFSTWVYYTQSLSQNTINRELVFHLISFSNLKSLIITFAKWVIPVFLLLFFFLGIKKVKFFILSITLSIRGKSQLLIIITISYILFLFISVFFIDAHIHFNNRILSPVYILLLALVAPFLDKIIYDNSLKKRVLLIAGVMVICMTYSFSRTYYHFYTRGLGYTGDKWIQSETLHELQKMNYNKIYSNGDDVLKYYLQSATGINSLPKIISPYTLKKNHLFDLDFNDLEKSIAAGESLLVYFENISTRYYYPGKDSILSRFSAYYVTEFDDGFIIENIQ